MKMTLKSGATLDVTRSPFEICHRLFKTVIKELKSVDLELGQNLGSTFSLDLTDKTLNTAKNAIFTLLSSQEIEDVLWECFGRVLYNNKKLTKNLFDEEKAMEDYLEIAKEVLVFNLTPFQKSLESLFPGVQLKRLTEGQKNT